MSEVAINIEGLWKQYKVGSRKSSSLRESLMNIFNKDELNYFWALQDINFEVKKGEAVGIIGGNGAGKSTLLKVLSKITYPTKGKVEINGRVSSLLEVGTGFHPELSGRQNIYLNGTILGMTRKEITQKFDEIVAFSGVEKFIDTPVKHYSSGMKVRLAFSVAAHLEPEILIIDEVLAVGDADFQRKCLGKMEDVTGEGRTVLFVSHNMGAIQKLCTGAIAIDKGTVKAVGTPSKVISDYLDETPLQNLNNRNRLGNGALLVKSMKVKNCLGEETTVLKSDEKFTVELYYEIKRLNYNFNSLIVGIGFKDQIGNNLILHHNRLTDELFNHDEVVNGFKFSVYIEGTGLNSGIYHLNYSVMQSFDYIDHVDSAQKIEISKAFPFHLRELPPKNSSLILVDASWSIN